MRDFVVDGFERSIGRHDARQIMLQDCAEDAATNDNNQEPHQDSRERPAEVKAAVEEKDREAQQSEPEMTAHPGLRAAETPGRHTLSRAQKRRENHGREPDDAKEKANCAATARPLRREECIRNVDSERKRSEEHTSELQSPCISYAVFCLKKNSDAL